MLEFLTDWLQRLLRQPAKLMYIGGSDILPPPLAAQEEQSLLQQAAAGDEAARARLIERNLRLAGQKAVVSLDEPINTDWDGNELLLSDVLGTDGDIVMRPMEEDAEQQLLREALARLPERERRIVSLRFGLGGRPEKTQKEVADLLGISQSYISRLEKRIMQRLRRDLLRQVS